MIKVADWSFDFLQCVFDRSSHNSRRMSIHLIPIEILQKIFDLFDFFFLQCFVCPICHISEIVTNDRYTTQRAEFAKEMIGTACCVFFVFLFQSIQNSIPTVFEKFANSCNGHRNFYIIPGRIIVQCCIGHIVFFLLFHLIVCFFFDTLQS